MRFFRAVPVVLAAALGIAAEAQENVTLSAAQVQSLAIVSIRVDAGASGGLGGLPARVTVPNEQLRVVAAPVAGMVESLAVAPGQPVRRGQTVARLASREVLELQRDALQADSQARLAEQTLRRDEQLFSEGLIAEARLQAARASAAQAAALAAERRQGLQLAGAAAGRLGGALTLVSPIDGVVLEQGVQVGQRLEAATPICRIARLSPLWLEIQAPLALAAAAASGAPVTVAGSAARGRLIAVGATVEPGSQSVLLRAAVDNPGASLRPGQAVEVEVQTPAGSGARLPAAALFRHEGRTLVFVEVGSDARGTVYRPQPVRVLGPAGEEMLVEGLPKSTRVVTRGVSGLKAVWTGVGKE